METGLDTELDSSVATRTASVQPEQVEIKLVMLKVNIFWYFLYFLYLQIG